MTSDIPMDPRLDRRIVEKKAALDLQRPLPAPIVAKLYEDLRIRLTYHSNAIEGNDPRPQRDPAGHRARRYDRRPHHA